MFTPNRGYPLLGGQSIDDIGDDLAAVNQALTAIDTDIQQSIDAIDGFTLLNQTSYDGVALFTIGWDFNALGADVSPGSAFLATWENVVLNTAITSGNAYNFALQPGDASGNNCFYSAASLTSTTAYLNFTNAASASKRWVLMPQYTGSMYIRKVSAIMKLGVNGADVEYTCSFGTQANFTSTLEAVGRGSTGYGIGSLANNAVKPTQLHLFGGSATVPYITKCDRAALYRMDSALASKLF